jgi:putative thioredoxin
VVDVTDATFATEVLERSKAVPVVVDLWATWCGPCTTLGPMLEASVAARGGSIALAKVDVDANPEVAQMFQVQSIPAVFGVKDGRVVDSFIGAVGQGELDAFLDRLTPEPSEADLLVAAGDEASLRKALALEPANARAIVALAALLIDEKQPVEALELLAKVPPTPESRALEAQARLAEQEIDVKSQEVTSLLDDLLERVKDDEGARQEFLDVLETLGLQSPVAIEYRKKLAARLF